MSDFDPSLIFLLTYDENSNVSYLKVLKMLRKDEADLRSVSFAEKAGKEEIVHSVKSNLVESGA